MSQFHSMPFPGADGQVLFEPASIDYKTNVAKWLLPSTSYDASSSLTFSLKLPTAKSTRSRIRVRAMIPIMDPVNTTKKVDEVIVELSFQIPKNADVNLRSTALLRALGMAQSVVVQNAVESNQGVF